MRNYDKYKFSIIGGDMRSAILGKLLYEKGHEVHFFGLNKIPQKLSDQCLHTCNTLAEALSVSEILIFPIPFSIDNQQKLNAPFNSETIYISFISEMLERTNFKGIVIGGKIPSEIVKQSNLLSFQYHDLLERDDLAILNSIPTAEGALQIAMEELPYTIHGSNTIICGNGRVGLTLSHLLKNVGAKVTVAARKNKDFAICESNNLSYTDYVSLKDILPSMRLIYNTVPAMIFTSELIDVISPDAVIIDLASMPGGVDFEYAHKKNIKTHHALSLPGKVAPMSAANIIQKVIFNILNENNNKRS